MATACPIRTAIFCVGALIVAPCLHAADAAGTDLPWFSLTKGHGAPVCEAYLKRLNESDYTQDHPVSSPFPYCGIPESNAIPGFQALHLVPLSKQVIAQMSDTVFKWWERPNPLQLNANWGIAPGSVGGSTNAWRYDPPIDVDNDGKADNIVLWRGYGLQADVGLCGEPFTPNYKWGFRPRQLPIVVNNDLSVDAEATASTFGRTVQTPQRSTIGPAPFQPVGHFITPFIYRGVAYFSTFFDVTGDYRGQRKGDPNLANVLGVLLRRNHKTQEVCEYRMRGDDFPPKIAEPSGVVTSSE